MKSRAVRRLLVTFQSWAHHTQAAALSNAADAFNDAQRRYYARKAAEPKRPPRGYVHIDDPRFQLYKRKDTPHYWVPGETDAFEKSQQLWKPKQPQPKTFFHKQQQLLEPEQRQALLQGLQSQLHLSDKLASLAVRAVETGIIYLRQGFLRRQQPNCSADDAVAGELAQLCNRLKVLQQLQQQFPSFQLEVALARDLQLLALRPAEVRYMVTRLQQHTPDADPGALLMAASAKVRYSPSGFSEGLHQLRRLMHVRLGLDPLRAVAPGSCRSQFLKVSGRRAAEKMDTLLLKLARREQHRLALARKQQALLPGGRQKLFQQRRRLQQQPPEQQPLVAALLEPGSGEGPAAAEGTDELAAATSSSSISVSSSGPELDPATLQDLQSLVQTIYRRCPMLFKYSPDTLAAKIHTLQQQLAADPAATYRLVAKHPALLAADLRRVPNALQQLQKQLELSLADAQQLLMAEPALISSSSAITRLPERLQQLQQLLGLRSKDVAVAMALRHPKLLKAGLPALQQRLQQLPQVLGRDESYVQRLLAAHPLLATYTVATIQQRLAVLQQLAAGGQEVAAMQPRALGTCLLAGREAYERMGGLLAAGGVAALARRVAVKQLVFMSGEQLAGLSAQRA